MSALCRYEDAASRRWSAPERCESRIVQNDKRKRERLQGKYGSPRRRCSYVFYTRFLVGWRLLTNANTSTPILDFGTVVHTRPLLRATRGVVGHTRPTAPARSNCVAVSLRA